MDFKIRDIKPEDVAQTTKLYHETWLATYPNKELGITRESIDAFFNDRNTPERLAERVEGIKKLPTSERQIIAEADGRIIGICRVIRRDSINQLQAIYVLPECQGKGVGQALWDEAKKFLDSQRNTIVHVATYNSNAINFYKRNGFAETGKIFNEERHRLPNGVLIPETELLLSADL